MWKNTLAIFFFYFSVKAGEVFGLLGHNGAGKTTTMRIIVAEEAATAGRIRIGSRDIVSNQSEAFQVREGKRLCREI
jgi:ATP-binding cassette subfamily A (ABC1) protein 5